MVDLETLNRYRYPEWERNYYGVRGDSTRGCFTVKRLRIIAVSDAGWDHVSVSLSDRCPRWHEMEQVKRLFFEPDEVAMQLHVTPEDHVNIHPYVLHLWRPRDLEIPLPPKAMV